MSHFRSQLAKVLLAPPFFDNQRTLALHAGIDPSQLHRVYTGKIQATPEFVGRLCGTLPAKDSADLFRAFIHDVVAAATAAQPAIKPEAPWHRPLSDLSITFECKVRRAG